MVNVARYKLKQSGSLRDVTSDQQTRGFQANVVIDRDAAARLGVSPTDIDNTLYDAFGQRQVQPCTNGITNIMSSLRQCQNSTGAQRAPKNLREVKIGAANPLSTMARFESTNATLSVNHQGQFPAITLSFNLPPGVSLGEATDIIQNAAEELRMPASVTGSFQGTAQVFKSSLSNLPLLLAAALLAVYVVLGILYESLIHPITILSTLPSAGLGALLALFVAEL